MSEEQLHEFFAVTITGSLYRVTDQLQQFGWPLVERIASSNPDVKSARPFILRNGRFVGVTQRFGTMLYNRIRPEPPEMVNMKYWGGHTRPTVGLFLDETVARSCLAERSSQAWDERWVDQTDEVLNLIGRDHPVFILSDELLPRIRPTVQEAFEASWQQNRGIYLTLAQRDQVDDQK